jgi:ADP-heptose:LPS heptosyltransferase
MTRILIIRHGALGDFVQSFGPFAAIRAHHPGAEVVLLTTAPFVGLARLCPWFDRVEVDARPGWWDVVGVWRLRGQLAGFDLVYDLQTSGRSTRYFALAGRPDWSGVAVGARYRQAGGAREGMHTFERQRDQLRIAGIGEVPAPDLGFLTGREVAGLPDRFAMLVPGASPHRPGKRWPAGRFGELARMLVGRGVVPVVVGAKEEAGLAGEILAVCPAAVDFTGRTGLADLFAVAARAVVAVGNDTGPMHIAAVAGARCVVLFSGESDPALTAPRGPGGAWPVVLRENRLADLPVDRVAAALP